MRSVLQAAGLLLFTGPSVAGAQALLPAQRVPELA